MRMGGIQGQTKQKKMVDYSKGGYIFILYSPSDSDGSVAFRLRKMEVVEVWRGRNLSRR